MAPGGSSYRKANQLRYKKKKKSPGKRKTVVDDDEIVVVEEEMVVEEVVEPGPSRKTASEKKVKEIPTPDDTRVTPTGYRFMDMNLLGLVFSVVSCPRCKLQSLTMTQNKKQGLAFEMSLSCSDKSFGWCHTFWTSKKRSKHYDVNRRIYYSMRRIGNGYAGMKRFLMLMNHPAPMTEQNYRKVNKI